MITDVARPSNGAAHADASDTGQPFVVELTAFSGPLDLLLTLIREEQIDIYDIPIARIAEQFLLRIKAQLLLPRSQDDDAWEDPRAELVRRLLEYQQMREVVDILERLAEERRRRFARAYLPQASAPPAAPLALSLSELLGAVDRILRVTREPTLHDVVPRALDVDGAISTVRAVLAMRASARWSDMLRGPAEPWEVLSMLLALLELARRGELRLTQSRPFESVEIERDPAGQAA